MSKESAAERRAKVQALMAKINKTAKHKVIAFANEVPNSYFLRRPCGITQLDIDTGGGLPAGGLSYISGPENAGKSFLLFKYFAMHQRLYGESATIAYAPTEGGIDYWFMRKCGVIVSIPDANIEQQNEYRVSRGLPKFTKEEIKELKQQVGTFTPVIATSTEELLDTVLMLVDSKLYGIVAVDSISAAIPEAEAKLESLEDNPQQAANASLLTRFLLHYFPMTAGIEGVNETTLIFTAQVRSNRKKQEAVAFMQKFIKDWTPTGAWAARHGKLLDVVIWGGAKDKDNSSVEGKKIVVGKELNWEISKGKAGTHDGITGQVDFTYANLTDDLRSIVTAGIKYGCIVEKNGKMALLRPETGEVSNILSNIPGQEAFISAMKNDSVLEFSVRREVLAAAGIQCNYR